MSRLLAALVVFACAPLTALAQGETSAAAAPSADWNFGGGLPSRTYVLLGSTGLESPSFVMQFLPAVEAALERRLSARTWLAFGVSGSYSRRRDDVPPGSSGW